MAEKNYIFIWDKYFVGVEEANLYLYLKDIFFKLIQKQDSSRPVTAHSIMAGILGGDYGFISSDYGNFSKNIRGLTAFASRSRNSVYSEQLRECAAGRGWLGAVLDDIDDRYNSVFSDEIDNIKSFFRIIMEKREYIESCHADCKGFDAGVLQKLLDSLDLSARQIKSASFENRKRIYARCLIMGLTYFLANGQAFLDLTQTNSSPLLNLFCSRYSQQIPSNNFESDYRLYAEFASRDKKARSLVQLADSADGKHIFITGDGGAGKTTAMRLAAQEYNRRGVPAVYIPCNRADNLAAGSRELQCFIADYIGSAFDEYAKLAQDSNNACRTLKSLLDEKIPYTDIIVFLDGFNETSATATLSGQIAELSETIGNLQFVISSRYASYYFKDDFIQAKTEPLNPKTALTKEQYATYCTLDTETKRLLTSPMFLKLFMQSETDENITAASLLMQDFQRTVQKNPVPSVLKVFLPDLAFHCYTEGEKMVFTYDILAEVAQNYTFANVATIINALKISGYVLTDDDYNFVFRHEHIRDFLAALAISGRISSGIRNSDSSQLIIDIFSAEKQYSIYVRRFLAELMGRDTIITMLETLSADRLPYDVWTSHKNAVATGRIIELIKIITKNCTDMDFYGLNLSLTSLNGTQITDAYFARSLISDFTFAPMGHDSAVFALFADSRDNIYALGKNRLIKYSSDLSQLDALDYSNGYTIHSHAAYQNIFGVVNSIGTAYIFDISQKLTLVNRFTGAVSVEASTGGLLFGFTDGSVAFCNTAGKEQWRVSVDNCPVMPVKNRISSEIMYATADSLKLWSRRNGTKVLWKTDHSMDVIRTAYNSICRSAVLVLNHFGETNIISYNEDTENISTVMETTVSEQLSEYLVQQSVGIDPTKCTGIAFADRYMLNTYNSGHILIYKYLNNDWQYIDDIEVVNNKNDNPGTGLESACFVTDGVVCGLTNRILKLISFSLNDPVNNGAEKHRASGHNSGLRRIFMSDNNNLYATMYDRGFVHLKRNTEGRFSFADKVFIGNDWCWAGTALNDGRCAFASGDTVYIYDNKVELCHKFSGKVENLFATGNILFAAVGSKVYTIDCNDNFKTEAIADSDDGRRAICFAGDPLSDKIYIGYSSHADKQSGCLMKIYDGQSLQTPDNSLWKHRDGWYRSIEFSNNGQFILCSGLKEEKTAGVWQNVAVLFDRGLNQLAILEGHKDSVMKGIFLSSDQSQIVMATCSYDGFVNIYQSDISALGKETRLSPVKSSPEAQSRLMDMLADGNDILACCLDGNIYRWHYSRDKTDMTVDYENICGLWTSYSDLSQIDECSKISRNVYEQLSALNNQMPQTEWS